MRILQITLCDDEGLVLGEWSIGDKREYDIDDLAATPQHDFYAEDGKDLDLDELKTEILREAKRIKTGSY